MATPELPTITEKQIEEIANRFLTQGATFKELKGISDEELEAIYAVGHNLFTTGRYEDAEDAFRLLCFLDHLNKKFWLGLGLAGGPAGITRERLTLLAWRECWI